MKLPTDFQILNYIYAHYYDAFSAFDRGAPERRTKIYIPIDISAIANRFGVDQDIVFGRLYYHLEEKLSYKRSDGSNVHFFMLTDGSDRHCVNFPLLASILAGMRQERRKDLWAISIAVTSIVISVFLSSSRLRVLREPPHYLHRIASSLLAARKCYAPNCEAI